MKLTTTKTDLIRALNNASRAVPSRPTHAVLGNVKIDASIEDERVYLAGFDLSIGIENTLLTKDIEKFSSICVPAKIFTDIVSKLPDGDITLLSDDDYTLTIKTKSGKYNIVGMSAEEFPEFPEPVDGQSIMLSASDLLAGINQTIGSASTDETKQILTAVNIQCLDKTLTFAATDGHRLSTYIVNDIDGEFNLNIPAKTLAHLQKIIGKSDQSIQIEYDNQQLKFITSNDRIISRTMDGRYPDYKLLMPKSFSRKVTVDRKEFIDAIELIQLLSNNNTINCKITNSEISINAETEKGSGDRVITTFLKTGDDILLAFNGKYLLDGLKIITTQDVEIHLNEPLTPVILKPVGDIDFTYLVMPVQIRG